ncbi:hypothetical protein B0H14DRAFT_3480384 [Mycena olivaceomarginata]|nr:hypothetical protein B0H14DRAFT_3480384 [Mycena olivaceomarginata]
MPNLTHFALNLFLHDTTLYDTMRLQTTLERIVILVQTPVETIDTHPLAGNARFVCIHQSKSYRLDWLCGALSGNDYWVSADAFIAARHPRKVDASRYIISNEAGWPDLLVGLFITAAWLYEAQNNIHGRLFNSAPLLAHTPYKGHRRDFRFNGARQPNFGLQTHFPASLDKQAGSFVINATKVVSKEQFDAKVAAAFENVARVETPAADAQTLATLLDLTPEKLGATALRARTFTFLDIAETGLKAHSKEFLVDAITAKHGHVVNTGAQPFNCHGCGIKSFGGGEYLYVAFGYLCT